MVAWRNSRSRYHHLKQRHGGQGADGVFCRKYFFERGYLHAISYAGLAHKLTLTADGRDARRGHNMP